MTRSFLLLCGSLFPCLLSSATAQIDLRPTEGLRDNTPRFHVLRGATIIPAPGKSIPNGTVVLRDGLVEAVGGAAMKSPEGARVWDLAGKTIYPGFIEPWHAVEVGDGAGNTARYWNRRVRPERLASRALDSISDDTVGELRGLGFTIAQLVPKSGVLRGSSCTISLRDGAAGERILSKQVAQCAAFEHGGGGYPGSLMGSIALMRQALYDARWHRDTMAKYLENPKGVERPATNVSLDALRPVVDGKRRVLFASRDELSYERFLRVAAEFELRGAILGNGFEYRVTETIKQSGLPLVVPIQFPAVPAVEDLDAALDISLAELRHWELAPSNPATLEAAEISFSLTSAKLSNAKDQFWKNLRRSVERGLSEERALSALTVDPAKLVGMFGKTGTIAKGKLANLVVADGNLFAADSEAKIESVWVDGLPFEQEAGKKIDLSGDWEVKINGVEQAQKWKISGDGKAPKIEFGEEKFPAKIAGHQFLAFPKAKQIGLEGAGEDSGVARLTAQIIDEKKLQGAGVDPRGKRFSWSAKRVRKGGGDKEDDSGKDNEEEKEQLPPAFSRYPAGAFGLLAEPAQSKRMLLKNATIWTSAKAGRLEGSDLLIENGKILAVGKGITPPANTTVKDLQGKHITPGLIDCHSHIAISRGVNEGTDAVTVEVRIGDVVDPTDIGIYRQLAGGLTTSNLLHGSANPMGGQNQVIKLRWGGDADGMRFKGAKPGVKFALGENVKQSNWGDSKTTRYPQTRMGVQQIMRDTFLAAREYGKKEKPRKDLRLDAALEILKGERIVHIHSYRQDEILMFVRLAQEFGFTVGTFQHVLEGYKVADAIAEIGAGGSTFSDWWAYKVEVYDAIPFNGALMREVGVSMSFNSDDSELATRMNLEAAKAVKYGGVPEEEALKFVTLNPAQQLRIDDRVGSLEKGKDADFVIWDAHPMSGAARALQTWIDGRKYYDVESNATELDRIASERERLIAKALPLRVKELAAKKSDDAEDEENEGAGAEKEKKKPGLRVFLKNMPQRPVDECRSVYRGLYHNGRSLHTCSKNGCCAN